MLHAPEFSGNGGSMPLRQGEYGVRFDGEIGSPHILERCCIGRRSLLTVQVKCAPRIRLLDEQFGRLKP